MNNNFKLPIRMKVLDHIKDVYPQESIGCIHDGVYIRFDNIAAEPEKRFELSVANQLYCHRYGVWIVHSHDALDAIPSKEDLQVADLTGLTSVIVATDGQVIKGYRTLTQDRANETLGEGGS